MHDIKFIRQFPQAFDKAMQMRKEKACAQEILDLDERLRHLKAELHNFQQERNKIAKDIGISKSKGIEVGKELFERAELLKQNIADTETEMGSVESNLNNYLTTLPNIPEESVPKGDSEEDNVVIKTVGEVPSFSFTPKEHYELGAELGAMDFEVAAKISGSRFVILKNELARMERALANLMLDIHTQKFGYQETCVPQLVKEDTMFGVGQLPKFSEDSFRTEDGYRLIPTSEVPLVGMVKDSIIPEEELPLRLTAFTQCFRSEAGSAGRDTHGMIRQHQFSKVELVSITRPQDSAAEHERMLQAAESILQVLELPYRVSMLSTGDLGFCARKTYDIEVWLPGQEKYREISSCSNCGAFQAHRLKARYKELTSRKNQYVHTLNGSGLAVGRTIIAILENYQQEDGSIVIPEALQKYMGGIKRIGK